MARDDFNIFIQKNWYNRWWKALLQHFVTQAEYDTFNRRHKKERLYMYDLRTQFQQEPEIRDQMKKWIKDGPVYLPE